MKNYLVLRESSKDFYRFMEDGRPVTSTTHGELFAEEEAAAIVKQLPSFDGGSGWRSMPIVSPELLVTKTGGVKQAAAKCGCCTSTIQKWRKSGKVGMRYMLVASEAVA